MRIAQLGTGRIGKMHFEKLLELVDPQTLMVADVDPALAERLVEGTAARAVSVEEAIAAADALVIAASSSAHPDLIRAGLTRGVPIFCEKPLAVDLAETRRLVDEIEASGIRFQLGFQRRFDAGYREARRLIESGELGRLYVLCLRRHPLAYRPGGRRGLCRWRRAGVRDVREVRRRRHRGRHPPIVGGDARDPVVHAARPARLRHPDRAVRIARQRERGPWAAHADAVRRAGRAAAGGAGMDGLP
jgi:GFO/IDH/MocA oxidoreductase family protein